MSRHLKYLIVLSIAFALACSSDEKSMDLCEPETDNEICETLSAECGAVAFDDRCGSSRSLSCGICGDGESCINNVCSCSPKPELVLCDEQNVDCGQLTLLDNCDNERTVNCGTCPVGSECGSSTDNVCGCPCLIDQQCYPSGSTNLANPCLQCLPALSENAWSVALGVECDDDNTCTDTDVCTEFGACLGTQRSCTPTNDLCQVSSCDPATGMCETVDASDGTSCETDTVSCTVDVCVSGVCSHDPSTDRCFVGNACYVADQIGPNSPCDICDPTTSTTSFAVGDQIPCEDNDGLDCTVGNCNQGTCTAERNPVYCVINSACVLQGERDPNNPCSECNPALDPFAYSPLTGIACADGDNLACTSGQCTAGACVPSRGADWCIITGVCEFRGVGPGGFECRVCDPDADPFDWTNLTGPICGQAGNCNCSAGACIAGGGMFCL